MNCPDFTDVVSQGWNITVHGSPIFRVVQKLKGTKMALKTLASSSFHSPSAQVSRTKRQLETVQKVMSTDIRNTELQKQEVQLQANLAHWLDLEEDQLMQKCKDKWLKVGDRNSSFFYSSIKTRIARNNSHQLTDDYQFTQIIFHNFQNYLLRKSSHLKLPVGLLGQ